MKKILLWLVIGVFYIFLPQSFSQEIDIQLEKKVQEIAHQLRCPVCQGLSVKESMNDISVNMKNKIITLLNEGKTEQEVISFFVQRYGEWILRNPKKDGFNFSLWLLPIGGIVLTTGLVILNITRKK